MLSRFAARTLRSATTNVDVAAATAPSANQVLTATSSTAATWQTPSGGSGSATTKDINQSSHGFAVGDVVKFAGSTYQKAQADSAANAEVVGIVSVVTDSNNFTLHTEGYISTLSSLTSATTYFLSASSAGALTSTEPSTAGQISKPVLITVSTTAGYFFNFRGIAVTTTPTVKTVYPVPLMPMDDLERNLNIANNTTGYFFAFYVPQKITVNQISFIANQGAADQSTYKVAVYSEDGATRHISVTTANVTANGQMLQTAVSAVALNPGLYYIGVCLTSNFSTLGFRTQDYNSGVWNAMNGYDLTSKPKASGTATITAGTLPSTIDPVAGLTEISQTGGSFFCFRLDN